MQNLSKPQIEFLKNSSGQALLIILLIMAVALTIGLSIVSRSVTDIQISQQSEEAARAFSAAEAGIEEALVVGVGSSAPVSIGTTSTYKVNVVGLDEGATEFAFPDPASKNDVQSLWLAKHNDDESLGKYYDRTQLRVVWGNAGAPSNNDSTPALEVIVYYLDGSTYKVGRFALDPNSGRSPGNSFCNPPGCSGVSDFSTNGSDTISGKTFQFGATLDLSGFSGTLLLARLRLLYTPDSHILGAKAAGAAGVGTHNLPSQGQKIDSTGQSGGATRKVEVIRFYETPPAIFDFALYSGGGIIK